MAIRHVAALSWLSARVAKDSLLSESFGLTIFALEKRDHMLDVRFACSPAWETLAAVRTFVYSRKRGYHKPWYRLVNDRVARLDLAPLLAIASSRGFVPDFLTPPPQVSRPRLRDQLAQARATPAARVAEELERCLESVHEDHHRDVIQSLLADPERARDLLAERLHETWLELIAPFWARLLALLQRDIDQRSRLLASGGMRQVLGQLHSTVRWTDNGLELVDRRQQVVGIDERGLVLMPSAFVWPSAVAVVDAPWPPTIVYPTRGIAALWDAAPPPPDALARLLGATRALVLASLRQPASTTSVAAILELSPAGASRHLVALRDAGLVTAERHGHEVRYVWTRLGSALCRGGNDR